MKLQSNRFDWSGLKFPVDLKQIRIFEKNNPSFSINVYGFERAVYPLRISETERRWNVNLLLISDGKKTALLSHQEFEEIALKPSDKA